MPMLDFKGKQYIYAHHMTVPYRPLVLDDAKSLNPGGADDSLIIHGDNLHALKALLPRYAGQVKCVYIDPPYNTGSQAWTYNDNVNSPLMQAWLREHAQVDDEDMERHDKWLCMMWPRLQLLKELLADDGVFFASIDDHEQWRLLALLEDVFGSKSFVATLAFVHNLAARPGKWLRQVHEYVHVFAKNKETIDSNGFALMSTDEDPASEWEQDEIGYYREGYGLIRTGTGALREDRPDLYFPIFVSPDGLVSLERRSDKDIEVLPKHGNGDEARWMWSRERIERDITEIIVKPHSRMGYNFITKVRPTIGDSFSIKPRSLWYKPQYSASNGTNTIKTLFNGERVFDFPKAVPFVTDLLKFANVGPNDLVLDSFAGSGTTAHAVLALNKEDGGNRKFILVECEDYADGITAERVRRVMQGVPGARDKALREGLSGSFTYCTLGAPIDLEGMLTGEALPAYSALAAYLLHTASGVSAGAAELEAQNGDGLFYANGVTDYYLLYEPDMNWLRGNAGVLNEERAKRIAAVNKEHGRKAVVFGPGKYMGQRELTELGITFCQLPYELHRAR